MVFKLQIGLRNSDTDLLAVGLPARHPRLSSCLGRVGVGRVYLGASS